MPRPRIYTTPEELAEAKRRWAAKTKARPEAIARRRELEQSPETKAKRAAYAATPEAQALAQERYRRYRQTDKYRATQARYAATAKNKATEAAYLARVRIEQPERIKARAAVMILVRKGVLERPAECQSCGSGGRIDAHHYLGYAQEHWLSVQWLCRVCHKAAHS